MLEERRQAKLEQQRKLEAAQVCETRILIYVQIQNFGIIAKFRLHWIFFSFLHICLSICALSWHISAAIFLFLCSVSVCPKLVSDLRTCFVTRQTSTVSLMRMGYPRTQLLENHLVTSKQRNYGNCGKLRKRSTMIIFLNLKAELTQLIVNNCTSKIVHC